MRLSLVIPCYNEQDNIPLIVARLREILNGRDDVEVLLVDNGSRDATGERIARETANDPALRLVSVPVNKGYGHGIKAGLAQAAGDILAWTHADMQTDPKDVLVAFDTFRAQPDERTVVKGRRQNRRALETAFTFGMQLVASAALRARLEDVNAQPKLFSRTFYRRHLAVGAPDDFSLDLYLLYWARAEGYRILDVPVVFANRLHGEAKGGGSWRTRIKLIRRTYAYIFELRRSLAKQALTK
ncbi:glycosyl transferase [Aureimonas endophytica]|uniref:Glycosyl transferase n=1 Tax=Aureimonas endophytica TaxID=2027858 RepID=A0A917A4D1_9HYPH|nr:glycosyl transferase [Aureimonas endophytica]